ncbi:gamma-glutamyltransferase family protein [Lichenicoccus sp.]|uniref:gamma-glutamyltransferase family protein n=1 Tax=Lichenicoccus sp. TaxID=2781899 RepID=UPI003D0FC09F
MTFEIDFNRPYPSGRAPVLGRNIVATSQPMAAQAGLRMLLKGGNAIDAAVAAAMTLTVVEPTGCGLGSDAFAIVWDGQSLHGLNASGRSPAAWNPGRFSGHRAMPERGWDSVTVPGAVSAWVALARRFGSLPLDTLAEPAITYAREGFQVSPAIATLWQRAGTLLGEQPGFAECFLPDGRAPRAGERFTNRPLGDSLEQIALSEGESFYRGQLAEKIAEFAARHCAALTTEDLGRHEIDWVDTISTAYGRGVVHELPPNGQGVATLAALGILRHVDFTGRAVDDPDTIHLAIEATKLALADLYRHVADHDRMDVTTTQMLDPAYLQSRSRLIDPASAGDPGHGALKPGGTVYLAAGDAQGRMVSFIQSNYMGFGSGIVVPGTGISLQNRGAAFDLAPGHPNQVAPSRRPFHTIIPGFAMNPDGTPLMAFGVMGGPIQAQGHLQMAMRVLGYGQNPQAAADAPRWRVVKGRALAVEPGLGAAAIEALRARGHDIVVEPPEAVFAFGGAQLVLRTEEGFIGGSDPRKDGQAVAF